MDAAEAERVGDLLELRHISSPRRAVRHIVGDAPDDTREAALEIAASIVHHRANARGSAQAVGEQTLSLGLLTPKNVRRDGMLWATYAEAAA